MPLFGHSNIEKLKAKKDMQGLIQALTYEKDHAIRRAAAVAPLLAILRGKASSPLGWQEFHLRKAAGEALFKLYHRKRSAKTARMLSCTTAISSPITSALP